LLIKEPARRLKERWVIRMKTVSYPLRIPKEFLELAVLRSKEEYVD